MTDGRDETVHDGQRAPVPVQQRRADDPLFGVKEHEGNADRADGDAHVVSWLGRAAGNELREGGYGRIGPLSGIEDAVIFGDRGRVGHNIGRGSQVSGQVEATGFDTRAADVEGYDKFGHRSLPSGVRG